MPFDDSTRGRLQTFVGAARDLLAEEFAWQLQQTYGMDPASGEVAGLDRLGELDDQRLETARILREIMEHYLGALANPSAQNRRHVLDRIVREQAFTVLNRLAALRLMEARGILLESVAQGYQSKAFQLYQMVAGSAVTGASRPPMRNGGEPSNLRVIRTARVERWIIPALMPCIRTGTKLMHIAGLS